jgi:2-keto-4-pentenoate hydratase/2-oxohepta-3-ene-1,7-dioic acid hydratase in catechol pathway
LRTAVPRTRAITQPDFLKATLQDYEAWRPLVKATCCADHEVLGAFVGGVRDGLKWLEGYDVHTQLTSFHLAGYCILNAMSDRHWQTDQNGNLTQVVTAKSFDTFAPLGPMLVTPDEIDDPDSLQIKLWVNDELRQDFNSREYIYGVDEAIEFCSQFFTPFPGDIISMGSGPGNAFFWKKYLEVGDRVKATIDGPGVQAFSVAAEA